MPNGDLDLADIDFSPAPADWMPEQDELPFDAADKDDDADG